MTLTTRAPLREVPFLGTLVCAVKETSRNLKSMRPFWATNIYRGVGKSSRVTADCHVVVKVYICSCFLSFVFVDKMFSIFVNILFVLKMCSVIRVI